MKSEDQNKSAIKKRVSICLDNLSPHKQNEVLVIDELLTIPSEPRVSLGFELNLCSPFL
jgi:hypothetical protein